MIPDAKSRSIVMTDAADGGRKHSVFYVTTPGASKPHILTLYTNLCNLKLVSTDLTEYISRAERLATSLKSAGEALSDSFLIAMMMKGLPESFNNCITVVTQSSKEYTFVEFKSAIRNYSENEKSRCVTIINSSDGKDTIRKLSGAQKHKCNFVPRCYGCRKK